jgi:hypothetical protein
MTANSRYRTILPDPAAMMDIGDFNKDAKGCSDYRDYWKSRFPAVECSWQSWVSIVIGGMRLLTPDKSGGVR